MENGFQPLTPATWHDFVQLFGAHGAYGGCWCMFWRQTRRDFSQNCGERNKIAMKALVDGGVIPGIIAYQGDKAVGWVSIAPREDYSSLERSRTLKRIDNQPVWSIVCFYAPKNQRGNLMERLLNYAIAYAQAKGAKIIEAYPSISKPQVQPVDLYMGSLNTFLAAGFEEQGSAGSKVIVRKFL